MKKLVLGSLMVVMAASLVGGCGSSSTTTSNNKLIVGTNATFVPFELKMIKPKIMQVSISI